MVNLEDNLWIVKNWFYQKNYSEKEERAIYQ